MKYFYLFSILTISSLVLAQSPESFKYQALIRNSEKKIVANQNVSIKVNILQNAIYGISIYEEMHSTNTNSFGTVNLEVGKGETLNGSFSGIEWGNGSYFIKIEIDINNDNIFEEAGTTQLLSVPYALYAAKSGESHWKSFGNNINYSKGKVGIGFNEPIEALHINGSIRGNGIGGSLRINTDFGYLDLGPRNADYSQFYTDRPYGFYFGGSVTVREHLIGYRTNDLHLSTQSGSSYQPEKRISILNSNGYVGIGKTDPAYNLDVNGTINASSILINGSPIEASNSVWSVSGNNTFYNGNVGIGIETPIESLHINGNIRGNRTGGTLRIKSDYGYLDIGAINNDYAHFYTEMPYGFFFGGSVTVREHIIGSRTSDLHISTQSNFTYQPVKRISILNSNGFVGIGTDQPKTQLQIESGDIYLNDVTSGVIMKSPDGQCWKLTVGNSGSPIFTSVACP